MSTYLVVEDLLEGDLPLIVKNKGGGMFLLGKTDSYYHLINLYNGEADRIHTSSFNNRAKTDGLEATEEKIII